MSISQAIYMPTRSPIDIKTYSGGQWVSVLGESSVISPKPPVGRVLNIGTRTCTANGGGKPVSSSGALASTKHMIVVDATNLSFEWDISNGMLPVTVGGSYRASYSVNGGSYIDFTFSGSKTFELGTTVEGLKVIKADKIYGNFYAGDEITVYSYVLPGGAGSPFGSTTGTISGEQTATGAYSTAFSSLMFDGTPGDWALRPSRILANSDKKSWIVGGDSIMQQNDSYVEQALAGLGLPATKTAQGGEAYANFPSRWGVRYAEPIKYASRVVDELGINDTNTDDWRNIARQAINHWKMFIDNGAEVVLKTTLTLYVGSSDQWRTLEGQSSDQKILSARVGFNRWLRDGAPLVNGAFAEVGTEGAVRCKVVLPDGSVKPGSGSGHPLTAVTDVASAIEEGETGKYTMASLTEAGAPGTNMDGLHPNAGIHKILARRVSRDIVILGLA